jgi:hypothetical protein
MDPQTGIDIMARQHPTARHIASVIRRFVHAGIRRTGSRAFMDWRGNAFSAYDLRHGVITANADAQVVKKSRESLDGP